MNEAMVSATPSGPNVKIVNSPIPEPGLDDILIQVVVSGSNPKDWKYPELFDKTLNSGDDVAGLVHKVGENVTAFHAGDRVAAFHVMGTAHGSFAEYAVAPSHTAFHIPKSTSFEQAATVPLAAATAVVGLFTHLGLPQQWTGGRADGRISDAGKASTVPRQPLLVWGGATAVGAFAIQLAKRANIGPIIAVTGRGKEFVQGHLDQASGDVIIDYRQDKAKIIADIEAALPHEAKLKYCFDAVSEHGSSEIASEVLKNTDGARLTRVLRPENPSKVSPLVELSRTMVGDVHTNQKDLGQAWFALFGRGLQEGWLKPHPHVVVPGGLAGVQEGLTNLRNGKASATKYVFRIADTPEIGA